MPLYSPPASPPAHAISRPELGPPPNAPARPRQMHELALDDFGLMDAFENFALDNNGNGPEPDNNELQGFFFLVEAALQPQN